VKRVVVNPAGLVPASLQIDSRYRDVDEYPSELQSWMDVLHAFSVKGRYGTVKVVVCRNWPLACNIAIYDSRNIVPDNLDSTWRVCFRSGVYKVVKTQEPYADKTCLTVFPHTGSEIVAESRRGVRTIIRIEN